MDKTFSCNFENCNATFLRRTDLNKHIIEHEDPSRLLRCTECPFVTKYPRGLMIHGYTHSDERPFVCPDTVKVPPSSEPGDSAQPSISETPCNYRSNCTSALIKHRVKYHNYVTGANRSQRGVSATSRVNHQGKVLRYAPFPAPPQKTMSSSDRASYSAPQAVHPFVTSSVAQPFDNKYDSVPDANRNIEAWNENSHHLTATLVATNPLVASQNNHTHYNATTSRTFPNGLATMLYQNSLHYPANNAIAMSNSVAPGLSYNATSLNWLQPGRIETGSANLGSVASYTANSCNSSSAASYTAFPAILPSDNRLASHPITLHGGAPNNVFTFAQELTNTNSAAVSQYARPNRSVTSLPFPLIPNGPPMVSQHDSGSFYIPGEDSAQISPGLPRNATTLPWLEEPTDLGSAASYTSNYSSLPYSRVVPLPSPVEIPDNNVSAEQNTLYGDASNLNPHTDIPVVEPIDASSSVGPQNNSVDRGVTLVAPSPLPVPEMPVNDYSSADATEFMPSPELESELHADEIFFRGTGREACLCPEMMIDAGIDGWDRSLLNTHQEYFTRSFA